MSTMKQLPEIYFQTREEWREWLAENHDQSEGVWLVFHNKNSGMPTLSYDDAVEEALCFGWIDGIIKNVDNKKYLRKITPRTNLLNWSAINRKRVEKMIEQGLMTEVGLFKIGDYSKTGKVVWPEETEKPSLLLSFSPELLERLKQNQLAYNNFCDLSPSHQKRYALWVMNAKQEETRKKRLEEAILLLEKNHKNLLK